MNAKKVSIENIHDRIKVLEKQYKQLKQHNTQIDQWIEAWIDQWLHVMVGAKHLLDALEMTPDPSTLYSKDKIQEKLMNKLTPEQKAEIDALIALPDDQIDTSDAPETEHNFFKDHGIPDAEERFRVYKIFRDMYEEDEKGFPKFYAGYQLGYGDGQPVLNEMLMLAIKATCYIAENMTQDDQLALAGDIFRLVPEIIFKSQKTRHAQATQEQETFLQDVQATQDRME